jgi:hypothetical protein
MSVLSRMNFIFIRGTTPINPFAQIHSPHYPVSP